mgnify:CR=1 FL=1
MLLIMVSIDDPSFSPILSVKGVVISLLTSIQSIVSVSGRISPQYWEVFYKPTTSLFVSLLLFQQLRCNLLRRVLSKLICGRSWHFPSPFCYSNDLSSIPSFEGNVMLLSSLIISNCEDHVLFVLIHLTRVLCHLFKFFHLIKFCLSFQPECCQNYIILIHSYLVSTRVLPIPSCLLYSKFIAFQPLKVLWFHSFVEEAT